MNLERRYTHNRYTNFYDAGWQPVESNTYTLVTYMVAALLALPSTKQVTIHRENSTIEYRQKEQR